jgi:hypothetical protein
MPFHQPRVDGLVDGNRGGPWSLDGALQAGLSRIWVQGRGELPRGSLGRFQLPLKVGLGRAGLVVVSFQFRFNV